MCTSSYVVLGSIPPTTKFLLAPITHGSGFVRTHGPSSLAGLNATTIEPWLHGGALYRATRGLSVGVTTASADVARGFTASETTAKEKSWASNPFLMRTMIS